MIKGAIISECGKYRYSLWREWTDELFPSAFGKVMFVGLNPSTSDANNDDPTLTRCIGFAKAWGFSGLYMANLFAFRATKPRDMKAAADPVGRLNNGYLSNMAQRSDRIIVCWGNDGGFNGRDREVIELLKNYRLWTFKITGNGSPIHPLYQKKDCELIRFNGGEE